MGSHVTNLLSAAESLTEAERRELIELLAAGLDDPATVGTDAESAVLNESWQRVVAERSAEYDAGLAETVPFGGSAREVALISPPASPRRAGGWFRILA